MKSMIAFTAFLFIELAFGGVIDCEHYSNKECLDDTTCSGGSVECCYIDEVTNICRANCTQKKFFQGQPGACDIVGCIADASVEVDGYEGAIECSPVDVTASPTSAPIPTPEPTTSEPTASDETKAPTQAPIVTPDPTKAPPTPEPTRDYSGDGRCSADGTVQEQVFGPSEYQCGDHNLGQPEERCIYIDASSTCDGTDFGECGAEDNAWPTFQSALDSLNGETVVLIVKAGTYSGEGNINIRSPNLESLNEYVYLNIFSESGSDDTIIDCKGEGFGFHLYQTTIRMDGFTVINCVAEDRETFSLPDYATNSYISSGPDSGRLGGAFFLDRTFITMNDMIIVNNGGEYGGAIFQYQNSIRMNNSIVEYNCATNSGGGIFLLFANLYMWNSYVLCNEADVFGGGIFGHQQRTDVLENALVDDNSALYADELFCDKTTVNVASESNGAIRDNDVDSWTVNAVTTCIKSEWGSHTCAFYDEDRSIDFCAASDSDLIDPTNLLALANDEGECSVEIVASVPSPEPSMSPTFVGETGAPTPDDDNTGIIPASNANSYKILFVAFVTMVILLIN